MVSCRPKADNKDRYQTSVKRDEWETILPEFVFRKTGGALKVSGNLGYLGSAIREVRIANPRISRVRLY
ncbi:hypothetical protein SAMN05877831_104201 [Rhodobacter maris]|uniref:Uncharacterized protein n=1 Tax=Rhodobacter maris TaxID=446682 RepID=A0A285SIP2_9RHOB|nr:hypothetical protein SAMN05877831_104201 [Rhodobacter maris]